MSRLGRWWVRHRRLWPLHRLVHTRWGCIACRAVWADVMSDPGFHERIRQSLAGMDAGRWYRYDTATGVSTPNPDWPKEGPQP